jgi:two-component system, response regulator YesN
MRKSGRTEYPWEIGTRLAAAVQARDLKAARKQALFLTNVIYNSDRSERLEAIKLRLVQILTIASRAAYAAGGDPDKMVNANLEFIDNVIRIQTRSGLRSLVRQTIRRLIGLVPEKDLLESQRLKNAIDYIRSHCAQPITRAAVAEHLGCSESYVSMLFTRNTGHTFLEIVLRYRMDKAKELLRQGQKTVTEIALAMGYKDTNYFSSCFRRVTGVSPGQFRRKISPR